MDKLPRSEDPLVIRTDFSDDAAWAHVCAEIIRPVDGFRAYVSFVDDRRFEGMDIDRLITAAGSDSFHAFAFLVDHRTLSTLDHPVLVVDLFHEPGRSFRVIPPAMWAVQNNLSLSNCDWEDFADSCDSEGVFRGH